MNQLCNDRLSRDRYSRARLSRARVSLARPARARLPVGLSALTAAITILLAACAGMPPPTGQVSATVAAVAHAAGAGANELAPQDMSTARDKLQRANVAMTVKDYPLAMTLSREAQVDAQLAEAKAETAKARQAADGMREGNRVLREEIDRKAAPVPPAPPVSVK